MLTRLLSLITVVLLATGVTYAETATVTCLAPNGGFNTDGGNFRILVQGETAPIEVGPDGSLVTLWSCGWDMGCQWLPYEVLPNSTWQIVNVGGAKIVFDPIDFDGDGVPPPSDCDDADVETYPGAVELCDEKDNNCDQTLPLDEQDLDSDGFLGCAECDDLSAAVHPGAAELPGNFVDENCDGNLGDCDPWFPWRNHGEYVRCVAHGAEALVEAGVLSQEEADVLVSSAAGSDIGKKDYSPLIDVSYSFSYTGQTGVVSMAVHEVYTIFNEPGGYNDYPDVAECHSDGGGKVRAYYHDSLTAEYPGTFGPWVPSGCSHSEEYGFTVDCCVE